MRLPARVPSGAALPRCSRPVIKPQPSGTPHERADALIERERHQFPFELAAEQRIVRLMRDVTRIAVAFRNGQRLHEMPAGIVRDADVAHFARAHHGIERREHFFRRRERIEAVELQEIDAIGPAAAGALDRPPARDGRATTRRRSHRRYGESRSSSRSAHGRGGRRALRRESTPRRRPNIRPRYRRA